MSGTFKLAIGQMLVEGGQADANIARAVKMIEEAGQLGCSIIVLPECMDVGWTHPSAVDLALPVPGPRSDMLAQAAASSGIYVVAGLTERDDDRLYNAAVFISPEGEILAKHQKINLLDIEQSLYSIGNLLSVTRTDLGTIGINICADNFPDSLVLGHSLARMGAQVILSPSAWAVSRDHNNEKNPSTAFWLRAYTTLARLYDIYIIGVSNVGWITGGPWEGMKCIGASLAVGPGGKVLTECPYGDSAECLVVTIIEPVQPQVTGTDIAPMLAQKGYTGP